MSIQQKAAKVEKRSAERSVQQASNCEMRVKGRNGAIKQGLNAYLESTREAENDDEGTENE